MDPRALRDLPNEKLRSQITDLERSVIALTKEVAALDAQAAPLRNEIGRFNQHLTAIKNEIDRRNRPAPIPRISDHALLRYVERVMGIDIESVRSSILTPSIVAAINSGASGVLVNGIKFVVSGCVITTTLGEDQRVKNKDAKHGRMIAVEPNINNEIADYYEERAAQT